MFNTDNKNIFHVEAKLIPLSPLFIGSGEDIARSEIAYEQRSIFKADIKRMAELTSIEHLQNLISQDIQNKRGSHTELESIIKKVPTYVIRTASNVTEKDMHLQLKEYIKTRDKMYVPGSSIKGAILSAIINTALIDLTNESHNFEYFVEQLVSKRIKDKRPNEIVFGLALSWLIDKNKTLREYKNITSKINTVKKERFAQWLQVSDTLADKPDKYGTVRKIKRVGSEKAAGMEPILIETLKTKIQMPFTLKVVNDKMNRDVKEILEIVDKYYRKEFEHEVEWLQKHKIRSGLSLSLKPNEYLIRIGYGTGNRIISLIPTVSEIGEQTGDYRLLATYGSKWRLTKGKKAEAQTKWMVIHRGKDKQVRYYPLGWAKIVLNEE